MVAREVMTLHLNLGSNLGDRRALLSAGAAAVAAALPGRWSVSQPIETEPWGFESEHPFLNIGMMGHLDANIAPETILDALQAIERTLGRGPHRDAAGAYIDRALDIDIISIDDSATGVPLRLETSRLTLPHPRAHLRDFVLIPLRELCPAHPLIASGEGQMPRREVSI